MRGFATWCTGHRKTVIVGWIVALVGIGTISGAVGANFTEEFKLPSSDSKQALDLLETRFPAQSGGTAQIVFKAEGGVESPTVRRKMEGAFAAIEKFPHVSEVASPYRKGGAAAISKDGKIAYATIQFDAQDNKLDKEKTREIIATAQGAAGNGLQVELGGQPIQEAIAEKGGDSSFAIGLLAAIVVLLLTFGSVVAMGLPILTALFALGVGISLVELGTHVFDTANFAPVLAAMIGLGVGIDYALFILTRFRNGLDEAAGAAPGCDPGRRHGRPRRPLRWHHRDHLADGDAVARHQLPLRGRGGSGAGGSVHDDRRADPAAGAADDRRPPGGSASRPRPRPSRQPLRRKRSLVPLEPRDPAPAGALDGALGRAAADPLHPDPLAAPRLQ